MGIGSSRRTLKDFQEERAEAKRRQEEFEANKINWLKMEDGETVELWLLQELDPSAENYSEKNGTAVFAREHTKPGPNNYHVKALCSMDDEEACFGCEKHREDWKAGWSGKDRLYINVLVKRANGDTEVAVWSQSAGKKGTVTKLLIDIAVEENTVTNRWFKVTREGTSTLTTYNVMPRTPSKDVNPEDYEVFDLNRCFREVPYSEQEAFYLGTASDEPADEEEPGPYASAATTASADW